MTSHVCAIFSAFEFQILLHAGSLNEPLICLDMTSHMPGMFMNKSNFTAIKPFYFHGIPASQHLHLATKPFTLRFLMTKPFDFDNQRFSATKPGFYEDLRAIMPWFS